MALPFVALEAFAAAVAKLQTLPASLAISLLEICCRIVEAVSVALFSPRYKNLSKGNLASFDPTPWSFNHLCFL